MARKVRIAVVAGDGIGPEVVGQALKALDAVSVALGLGLAHKEYLAGASLYKAKGKQWATGAFERCRKADAVLFGAVGLPGVLLPDGRPAGADVLFGLRKGLDLYANIRPVRLLPGVAHVISGERLLVWRPEEVDLVIVRENTEGLYSADAQLRPKGDATVDLRRISRRGSERIIRAAFELAVRRSSARAKDASAKVTCVDKSNLLAGCVLFNRVFGDVAQKYPSVRTDHLHIDAATLALLRSPESYDVLVTTNLFGDILSDMASMLGGGLGTAPSANIGAKHAMFEPVHGTAPDIAGKDVANPVGAMLSAGMMLDWLGDRRRDWLFKLGASLIERAVADATAQGVRTRDIGGTARCSEVGDAVAARIGNLALRMRETQE